ncbi:hypothetical protein HBH53_079190 [Parastagonospora nodorum]|nr:hypothetical protein HBH53_079190 [Parastagonospora nodorum]KAH4968095.1 hypothetical protein HBI78_064440 [Parastagonospora nodorum]KAH5202106.1 hypothetical protein HBH77_121980 [Parastagonospora nodorum]KAH5724833.1 hypothetical protein HBI18_126830 [Parastagonospora nodorum]KAH5784226.1 hypothetical protein HBI16_027690 [Parastagonospora nodorum]
MLKDAFRWTVVLLQSPQCAQDFRQAAGVDFEELISPFSHSLPPTPEQHPTTTMTPAPARVKELIAVGMYAYRHYQLGFVAPPAPRSSLRIHAIAFRSPPRGPSATTARLTQKARVTSKGTLDFSIEILKLRTQADDQTDPHHDGRGTRHAMRTRLLRGGDD